MKANLISALENAETGEKQCNLPVVSESLLEKYIEHVGQCEGVTFISKCNAKFSSDVVFSDEEIMILERLS